MSNLIYKVLNPIVKSILKSPLHGLMSYNTLVLGFTGAKSGQALETPVSYHSADGLVHCFTAKKYRWWKNLHTQPNVSLRIKSQKQRGRVTVHLDKPEVIIPALTAFLVATPRDAGPAGVRMTVGIPNSNDIELAASRLVYLKIELEN